MPIKSLVVCSIQQPGQCIAGNGDQSQERRRHIQVEMQLSGPAMDAGKESSLREDP